MIVETVETQAVAAAFREVESFVQSYISEPFKLTVRAVRDDIVRYSLEVDGREVDANMYAFADAAKVANALAFKLTFVLTDTLSTLDAGTLYEGWRLNVPCVSRSADEWTCEVAEHVLDAVESDVDYCRALLSAVDALNAVGAQGNA